LKSAKFCLHAIPCRIVCSPVFRNYITLKGDLGCILAVVIVRVKMIGAEAAIDAVVKIVGS
jgi:hypothetical protein